MCDCVSQLPSDLRSLVSHVLKQRPDWPILAALTTIESDLSRRSYHHVLRWADGLTNCPECGPRLNGTVPYC